MRGACQCQHTLDLVFRGDRRALLWGTPPQCRGPGEDTLEMRSGTGRRRHLASGAAQDIYLCWGDSWLGKQFFLESNLKRVCSSDLKYGLDQNTLRQEINLQGL